MKIKVWIILILIVVVIGLATFEEIYISNSLNKLYNDAISIKSKIVTSQNLENNLKNDIITLKEYWKKTENNLCYLSNHNDMKEVGDCLQNMLTFYELDDKNQLLEKTNLLIYYAESYNHILRFNSQNVI